MLSAAMYRSVLIGVLAGGVLLNGGAGIAAASSSSPTAQLCAEDVQALANFAEHGPTLTPTLRATVAHLIVRYEHRRAHCGLSVRVPTGGGGYGSVSLLTTVANSDVARPTPAFAAATSTGAGHTLTYIIGSVVLVLLVLAGVYRRRSRSRRLSSTAQ
jgi:hypothetical protein